MTMRTFRRPFCCALLLALTLALAIYLAAEALLEFVLFLVLRRIGGSAWLLFDGIITLILAVLVFKSWPSSSLWVIGTLVGISMLFAGASRLALSMAVSPVSVSK